MTSAVDSDQQRKQEAAQVVERFVRRFDESYRLLAYHAALPLVLTPELVNYLRNRFLRGEQVPWVAEVDLLLSDLCRPVGYELYVMDTAVRAYLLESIKDDPFWQQRMREVAQVLISYVSYLSQVSPGRRPELEAQRWAAMVYLGDEECLAAAEEIAERLQSSGSSMNSASGATSGLRAELARLARITQELAPQLQAHQSLVEYARVVQQVLRRPEFVELEEVQASYRIGDRELRIPEPILPTSLAGAVRLGNEERAGAVTQEFHISVTPVGNDEYLVRTERVAPGVPLSEEQVVWPVEQWLAQARQLMNDPLLGLLQSDAIPGTLRDTLAGGDRANPAALAQNLASLSGMTSGSPDLTNPPLSLVELGQNLYEALFRGTLRDSWVTAQGIAQYRNETLRLRLGLKGNRLPRLPWEVLYGNDTSTERSRSGGVGPVSRPLTAGTNVIFSRYQPSARLAVESLMTRTEPNQLLRVLMVIVAPSDRERLELERESNQLQRELQAQTSYLPEGAIPDIQLTILSQPDREQLTQALEQGRYQVLHYAGHSDLGTAGGSLYLVSNRTGLTEILTGDDLAGLLVNNGIRLAVFNSCRSAYTVASDLLNENEQNLAEALASRGIPAVLAMAEQIPDNVALSLNWFFYRNLKLGYPVDLSLSRARQGLISAYGSHQLYWTLPTLYLHPQFDGYLTWAI